MSLGDDARVALYYAPEIDDPLWEAGSSWLGRDCEANISIRQPEVAGIAELTAEPRLYGFHGTLKPPMRLREGANWDDVLTATDALASGVAAFELPPLAVADLAGFLALRETRPCPLLQAFADLCVASADALRAPPTEAELTRRRRARLSPAQDAMLTQWGYPYVFGAWFFHMTLTRRLTPAEQARVRPQAERHFADALAKPRHAGSLCVCVQPAPGQPFVLAERLRLRG